MILNVDWTNYNWKGNQSNSFKLFRSSQYGKKVEETLICLAIVTQLSFERKIAHKYTSILENEISSAICFWKREK